MKYFRIGYQPGVDFLGSEHHVSAGIAIKRKASVAVRRRVNKGKRCRHLVVHKQIVGIDSQTVHGVLEHVAERIIADLADKSGFSAELLKHGKHITGCSAGICFKKLILLRTHAVHGKIDKKLAKGGYIVIFHDLSSP